MTTLSLFSSSLVSKVSAPSSLAVTIQTNAALTTSSTFRNQKKRRNYPPRRRRLPLLLRSRGKTALLTHPSFDLSADNVAIQFLPADSLDMVPRTYTALDASDGPLANPFRFLYRHLRIFVSPDRDKRLPCWQLDCKRPSNQRLSPRHEFVVGLSQHQGPPSTKESKCK